jgi:hypothetical protein
MLHLSPFEIGRSRVSAMLALVLCLAGCAGSHPVAVASPDPDQAAGLVLHFYRDVGLGGQAAILDLGHVVSPRFYARHIATWATDYGTIEQPRVDVRFVHGNVVGYAVVYRHHESGWQWFAQRIGRWTLVGGNAGWRLDTDQWDSARVTSVADQYGHVLLVRERIDPSRGSAFVYDRVGGLLRAQAALGGHASAAALAANAESRPHQSAKDQTAKARKAPSRVGDSTSKSAQQAHETRGRCAHRHCVN